MNKNGIYIPLSRIHAMTNTEIDITFKLPFLICDLGGQNAAACLMLMLQTWFCVKVSTFESIGHEFVAAFSNSLLVKGSIMF